jgi:phosphoribosylaminoimidazole-succinocarboxamide synthase
VSSLVQDPFSDGDVEVVKHSLLFGEDNLPRRGKVRDIYDVGEELLIFASDRISAFDHIIPSLIPHKGPSLHALSLFWFSKTARIYPNHLLESIDDRTMRVLKAERIDVEWVVRGYLYGSAWRSYLKGERILSGVKFPNGLRLAEKLPEIVLTPTTKSESGHDLEITKYEALAKGIVTSEEWETLEEATFKLYECYQSEAKSKGIIIPDFKLEFGRVREGIIQIDEPPTHDSARFWSEKYYEVGKRQEGHCLDKEFLRSYLIRVCFMGEGSPPILPFNIIDQISRRCVGSYNVLSGQAVIENFDLKTVNQIT